ncbi:hypothetical protein [Acidobacterium sp. S8]|uniref:hypothetical protein n=1 Tax=Acidobacterium sp. S8 TaxID=1641854 RepID=UPI00131ECB1F|nr:hypothetical protein [Acidobacterium sp. S8]
MANDKAKKNAAKKIEKAVRKAVKKGLTENAVDKAVSQLKLLRKNPLVRLLRQLMLGKPRLPDISELPSSRVCQLADFLPQRFSL